VVVAGGKYTTYRVMAQDAVDAAVHALGGGIPASVTEDVPLLGAAGFAALHNQRQVLARQSGLHVARIEHMLGRYGSMVHQVLALVASNRPGPPLEGAEDYLRAELAYAASHEGARHLEDLLTRRARISIETFDRGVAAARPAAEIVAPILGWTPEQVDREVEHYLRRVEAERASRTSPTTRPPTPPASAPRSGPPRRLTNAQPHQLRSVPRSAPTSVSLARRRGRTPHQRLPTAPPRSCR